ncbi:hypothetical protein D3C80_1514500 [compost metagenome]
MVAKLNLEPFLRAVLPQSGKALRCKHGIPGNRSIILHNRGHLCSFGSDIVRLLDIEAQITVAYTHVGDEAFGRNRVVKVPGYGDNE